MVNPKPRVMNTIFYSTGLISFIIFMGIMIYKYGLEESISAYFKRMTEEYGTGSLIPWTFWVFLILVSAPLFAIFQNIFSFLAMVLLILTGAAAKYWKFEKPHILGASGGIIFGFVTLSVAHLWLGLTGIIIQLSIVIFTRKLERKTMIIEVAAVVLIYYLLSFLI